MFKVGKFLGIAIAVLFITNTALGSTYRVDFFGSTLTPDESFSGYAILDYSVVDSDSLPNQGTYNGLVTYLELHVNDASYVMASSVSSGDGVVFNDDVFYGDLFSFVVNIESTADGSNAGFFILQLTDTTNSVFADTSLPTGFTLDDFDPYNAGLFSTGAFIPDLSSIAPLEFVQITQVPLPAGLLLLLSGLATIAGFRKPSQAEILV